MSIDPFHVSVALLPLAVYLFAVGLVNLSTRPVVTSGARDLTALGIGGAGLVIVGPMELFLPEVTAVRFNVIAGPLFIWILMLTFYALCLSLVVLVSRPRLILYNLSMEELRPVLARVAPKIDPNARWAGDSLVLPGTEKSNLVDEDGQPSSVQLHVEVMPGLRHISLVANGPMQNYHGWRILEVELVAELRNLRVRANPFGWSLVAGSMLLLSACTAYMLGDPVAVAQGMQDMLVR